MDKVRYCIGDFDGKTFIPGEWHILDGGRCFYAPNVMQVPKGRKILWGWLKGGGIGKWNGCFTIPRELSLSNDENLRLIQKPVKEIEQLRRKQLISNTFEIRSGCPVVFHEIDLTQFAAVEIEFDVSPNSPLKRSFCMKLSGIPNSPMKIQPILELSEDGLLHCGNEIIDIPKPLLATDKIYVQIFLDRAFCEVFFNNDICISAHQLWFQKNQPISIEYSTENSLIHISNHNVWELNPLTQNFPSF
jgi:beta-fructofuranosidase